MRLLSGFVRGRQGFVFILQKREKDIKTNNTQTHITALIARNTIKKQSPLDFITCEIIPFSEM